MMFKEYREQADLSVAELARLANVDYRTCKRADDNAGPIQRSKARALIQVLNERLGLALRSQDIEGLEVQ